MRNEDTCAWVTDRLADHAAGDLEPREVAEVERHLAGCETCRGASAAERTLRETLGGMPLVRCPDRVSEAILAEVDATATARRRILPFGRRRAAWGLTAAAAVLVLLLAAPWQDRPVEGDPAAGAWTENEIAAARGDILSTLVLTAEIINRTERKTVDEVFGRQLPGAVNRSIKTLTTYLEGGQG